MSRAFPPAGRLGLRRAAACRTPSETWKPACHVRRSCGSTKSSRAQCRRRRGATQEAHLPDTEVRAGPPGQSGSGRNLSPLVRTFWRRFGYVTLAVGRPGNRKVAGSAPIRWWAPPNLPRPRPVPERGAVGPSARSWALAKSLDLDCFPHFIVHIVARSRRSERHRSGPAALPARLKSVDLLSGGAGWEGEGRKATARSASPSDVSTWKSG